jgi:hypothetical protein
MTLLPLAEPQIKRGAENVKSFARDRRPAWLAVTMAMESVPGDSDRVALCYWIHRSLSLPVLTPSLNSKKSHVNILLS